MRALLWPFCEADVCWSSHEDVCSKINWKSAGNSCAQGAGNRQLKYNTMKRCQRLSLQSVFEGSRLNCRRHLFPLCRVSFKFKWGAGVEMKECIERHFSILSVHNAALAAVTPNPDKYCNYQFCLSQFTRLPIVRRIHHAYTNTRVHAHQHTCGVLMCQIFIHQWQVKVRFRAAPWRVNRTVGESILNCLPKWARLC